MVCNKTSTGGKKKIVWNISSFLLGADRLIPAWLLYICLFVYISVAISRVSHDNILKYLQGPTYISCLRRQASTKKRELSLLSPLLFMPSEGGQIYHGFSNFKRQLIQVYLWHFVRPAVEVQTEL